VEFLLKTEGKRQEALFNWLSASCPAPVLKKNGGEVAKIKNND